VKTQQSKKVYAPGGKRSVKNILHMNDIEPPNVSLTMQDGPDTTHAAATRDNDDISGIKLDKVGDFALLQVILDGVVDLDLRVGITDRSTVVGDNEWYTAVADLVLLD